MTSEQDRNRGGTDTGSSEPGGGANRPAGTVDEDANPPISDPAEDTVDDGGGTASLPLNDTKPPVPPYEGRRTSASQTGRADDPGTGGASQPEDDPQYRSPKPEDTPGGATASPADEQSASQGSETRSDDEGVEAPAQVAGTRRGEDTP